MTTTNDLQEAFKKLRFLLQSDLSILNDDRDEEFVSKHTNRGFLRLLNQ